MNQDQKNHFDEHGWVLLPKVIPVEEIDAVAPDLFRIFPTPEQYHSGDQSGLSTAFREAEDPSKPVDAPAFRRQQFAGLVEAPFEGNALNKLALHESIINIAETALASNDVRLYQAETFAKYTGVTNYEQAWHVDYTNHTMLPPDRDRGYFQVQMFLFLSDVRPTLGATKIVSRKITQDIPLMNFAFPQGSKPDISEEKHEELEASAVYAQGDRGTLLVYSSDVVHKGTNMTEAGGSRFLYNLSFRKADCDWIGGNPWPRKGVHHWAPFIGSLTLKQLRTLGFPMPGHAYWSERNLKWTASRYPDLDLAPWYDAL